MALDAGRLRHVVDIEARDEEQDATTGGVTTTWYPLFTDVRAAIEPPQPEAGVVDEGGMLLETTPSPPSGLPIAPSLPFAQAALGALPELRDLLIRKPAPQAVRA